MGPCLSASVQVLLAKRKSDGMFYAVKVLQKKFILKNKEVPELRHKLSFAFSSTSQLGWLPQMGPNCEGSMGWVQRGWSSQRARWCQDAYHV